VNTADQPATPFLDALRQLHDVCARLDLTGQMARPTEAEYQRALRRARVVLREQERVDRANG
jgi:hypothetical protein